MTTTEARAEFETMLAKMKATNTSPDQIARVELMREWTTNPEFREKLAEFVYQINTAN
jgi:hypothetical protein